MQKLAILVLGTFAVLPLTSFGAADVHFSSGKFSSNGQHLSTGQNGHAEAALDAQGSLIRFGSNTVVDLGGEREFTLGKGLLLVSSGEGFLRRSGVVIHTPEGQITVRGTVLVAVLPDGAVKLTCLEGGVSGDLGGHGFSLQPGELIIQRGDGTRDTVQVNLHTLAHSCTLLAGGGFKPLNFAGSIDQAVSHQNKAHAASHHHSAGQHVAGQGQGESTSFLGRLFSGHGTAPNNNPGGNFGGSVSRVTMTLSQGGTASDSSSSVAGGSLTFSSNSMLRGDPSTGVSAIGVGSNAAEAALTAGSTSQQLVLTGSGGTFVSNNVNINAEAPLIVQSGAVIVSGSTVGGGTGAGAGVLVISGVPANNLTISHVNAGPPVLTLSGLTGQHIIVGTPGGASPP
ncbi:MAG: FecR protein [Prosthecobacter sp.]|nr:FecR protein [Prosthecobacter sp.]